MGKIALGAGDNKRVSSDFGTDGLTRSPASEFGG